MGSESRPTSRRYTAQQREPDEHAVRSEGSVAVGLSHANGPENAHRLAGRRLEREGGEQASGRALLRQGVAARHGKEHEGQNEDRLSAYLSGVRRDRPG